MTPLGGSVAAVTVGGNKNRASAKPWHSVYTALAKVGLSANGLCPCQATSARGRNVEAIGPKLGDSAGEEVTFPA